MYDTTSNTWTRGIWQYGRAHHAVSAGGHGSTSVGKSWLLSAKGAVRMFAYHAGIKLVSAAANIDAQALSKSLHIMAKLRITQNALSIYVTAQEELRIEAGGSFTTLNAAGITHGTAGAWEVKAATQHMELTGKSLPVAVPTFATGTLAPSQHDVHVQYHDNEPVQGAAFRIDYPNGRSTQGQLDASGRADLSNAPQGAGNATISLHDDTRSYAAQAVQSSELAKGTWTEADMHASMTSNATPGQGEAA